MDQLRLLVKGRLDEFFVMTQSVKSDRTMIDRSSGVSLWRQIEDDLRREIASGALGPGERLSTEFHLADRYGVNRHTVRRAISALVDKGLVRVDQGRGTFVQEDIIDYPVQKRTRFTENILNQSRSHCAKLVLHECRAATDAIARSLGLSKGAQVILLRLMREVDQRPVSITDHYFSAKRFHDLPAMYEETGSLTESLVRLGVPDYTRKITRVFAKTPSGEEARSLAQPTTRPILVTESVNVDSDGNPVEFGLARFAGDRVQLVFEP